jgi:murein DD-endopeptidase MepM/ murein hydrolase activator NlpD
MHLLLALLIISLPSAPVVCPGFKIPPSTSVVRDFAPVGRWAGHWGSDIAQPAGSPVRAIGDGFVRFTGTVVFNRTVSVDHGGGLITSYSYVAETMVEKGDRVHTGDVVGLSGSHGGRWAFHLSVRVRGLYVDPLALERCSGNPSAGLYLAVGVHTYAAEGARDPRRHIRPATQRSYGHGKGRIHPAGS